MESSIIRSFDFDGVINLDGKLGMKPDPHDIIITGRSYEELPETQAFLEKFGIKNRVYYNKLPFNQKTRQSSGHHKAVTILYLGVMGTRISEHIEDDPIQAEVIERFLPGFKVVLIESDVELENVKRDKNGAIVR